MAVRRLAQPSGLSIVDKAAEVANTLKVIKALDEMASVLRVSVECGRACFCGRSDGIALLWQQQVDQNCDLHAWLAQLCWQTAFRHGT